MDDLLKAVPKELHDRCTVLVVMTDTFCAHHLNEEYKQLCRKMVIALCRKRFTVTSGKPMGWAAGIVHAIGWMNFLDDPSQTPHMTSAQVAKALGVSLETMMSKSRLIRKGLKLMPFHPDWTLPSKQADNPLTLMTQLDDGMVIDIRSAPREFQEEALELGLIPFIPEKQEG